MIGKNSYQEFIVAGQLEASQLGVLHHRVEALRANGCVFQLKYFTSNAIAWQRSFQLMWNLEGMKDWVLLQGTFQVATYQKKCVISH